MKYCLDTSAIIRIFKEEDEIARQIRTIDKAKIFIPVTVIGELEVGYSYDQRVSGKEKRKKFYKFLAELGGILDVNKKTATEFGRIKAQLKKSNQLIGDNDTWIAAICKVNKATLITANKAHFQRVKGLKIYESFQD